MTTDAILIKQIQYAIQSVDGSEVNVRKAHAVTALRALTQASLSDAIFWVESRADHFVERPKSFLPRVSLPYISATPRLITSLKDFLDVIDAHSLMDDSYCEGCHQHAPKDMSPDGHGARITGPVPHAADCPFMRAKRLLEDLGVPR